MPVVGGEGCYSWGRTQTSVLPLLDCRRPARIRYVRQTTPAMWLSADRGLHSTEPEPFTLDIVGFLTFRFCSQWRCRPTNGGAPFLKAFPGTFGCACDCRSRSCSCGGLRSVAVVGIHASCFSPVRVHCNRLTVDGTKGAGIARLLQQAIKTSHQQRG